MDLHYLREATRSEHEATEAAMPLLKPDLTRGGYARILGCLLPILASWENWAEAQAPERLHPLLKPRRRSHLLRADLQLLGAENAAWLPPEEDAFAPAWSAVVEGKAGSGSRPEAEKEARFLGALYVLEGSTLGGRLLARHVEATLGLTPGQGNAYFHGHGAETGSLWGAVTAEIGAVPDKLAEGLVHSARRTFAAFREALMYSRQPSLQGNNSDTLVGATARVAGTRRKDQASKLP